ncbi:MAG: DUF45 domain-containing protein [Rhodobacteraceae bacterium]|nr:DUF45 domain-containing protein [Paracoccaceae bacterium]
MGQHHLRGEPPVYLTLRRSGRARRISLRISQLDGRVTLTVPAGVPEEEALDFAQSKAEWIRGHLDNHPGLVAVGPGEEIPLEGRGRLVRTGTTRKVIVSSEAIDIPVDRGVPRLKAHLRELARDRLVAASDRYAERLGKGYARISIRDTRSRWGSCSSAGALMYSWRLILAPPEVLQYVAAHEVAHLAEMNHSSRFWNHVEALYGDYDAPRRWLREQGGALHRFQF